MAQTKDFHVSESTLLPFDPIVLVRDVLKRWTLILLAVVIAGTSTYIMTKKDYEPIYQTSTTLVVTNRGSSSSVYSNLQTTSDLATVFTSLLNSSVLQKRVLEELDMTTLDCTITAAAIEETNLLTVQITADNPRTAFLVLQALIENHDIVTREVVGEVVLEVLQLPQVPWGPINSANASQQVKTAVILAAIIAVAAVLVYSYFRDTVRSRREAESKLKCWCLGELPHEKKYKTLKERITRRFSTMAIINPSNSFRFVEANRKLRRRVEQHIGDGRVVMVTSVMENEGKSTVSVNLALSLAMKHYNVLLIDLDLRKPACHKILQMKTGTYGTRDVADGKVDLSAAVEKEAISGLNVLMERTTVKRAKAQVASMVASEGLGAMIRAARERYDYVILDLPPLAAAPDAEYVMEHADASLLVVHQNSTKASVLNKAINILQSGNAKLLGCVLNNVYSMGFLTEAADTDAYETGRGRARKAPNHEPARTGKRGGQA